MGFASSNSRPCFSYGVNQELEIYNDIRMLTGDIIAYTAFSINYEKGKQMFAKVDDLVFTITKPYNNPLFWIPGYRFTFLSLDWKAY
jgi:hypothetical protein